MRDKELWERLRLYDFPLSEGRGTLRDHLVQKTTLGSKKAVRAIEEYRRFLYLAATSGEPVAPSPLIDRVWHTHINDTRAYIEGFSGKIIGRVVHHSPGRKAAADDPAYRRTLEHYAKEFGEPPFGKVWPSPEWLKGTSRREAAFFGTLVASVLLSSLAQFPLLLLAWPAAFGVALYIHSRYGYWSVQATSDGSGCSSCGGDGGGCGGD